MNEDQACVLLIVMENMLVPVLPKEHGMASLAADLEVGYNKKSHQPYLPGTSENCPTLQPSFWKVLGMLP